MDDENVAAFTSITGASTEQAQQYLEMSNNDLSGAMDLFYNMGGIDLGHSTSATPQQSSSAAVQAGGQNSHEVINLDSDDEETPISGGAGAPASLSEEGDAAMARRLQEELYRGVGDGAGSVRGDAEDYRAPIAPTRETLVGPDSYDLEEPDDVRAAVLQQMQQRSQHRLGRSSNRPGIFNQQPSSSSIWTEDTSNADSAARQAELARATGGASERSSKSTMLAEMFRPPFELMSRLPWDDARAEGKDDQKWILVNVQDPSIFDCQLLNRDLWKHDGIKETVRENFIFTQYSKDDPRGNQYMQYYFQDRELGSAYPHIAIVDPRTGEQVKIWSGPPAPKAMDFLMQLHEFLDRYSLNVTAKNPVAKRKPEQKKEEQVDRMTEDEQLEMALQQSLAGPSNRAKSNEADPDDLTRSLGDLQRTSDSQMVEANDQPAIGTDFEQEHSSAFSAISSHHPHEEPTADPSNTRIMFRHPTGRQVRRFALNDTVRRLYEWLKASPLDGMDSMQEFDLVFMGKNLIESLDDSIEAAGLKNASVNLEYIN